VRQVHQTTAGACVGGPNDASGASIDRSSR
jgi:hypothetical protein